MSRVFATSLGVVTPKGNITSKNLSSIHEILDNRFFEDSQEIPSEVIRSVPFEGKGMMSRQTKILMKALELCTEGQEPIDDTIKKQAQIFIGNGPVSLEERTIKSLIKYALSQNTTLSQNTNHVDYKTLSKNIERLAPLDGIKLLSTAPTHFISKELELHGPGQPIFNGTNSGLAALFLAYETLHDGKSDYAIVGSCDTPLAAHAHPYLKGDNQALHELSVVLELCSERVLGNRKPLFEIKGGAMATLSETDNKEEFEDFLATLAYIKDDGVERFGQKSRLDMHMYSLGHVASSSLLNVVCASQIKNSYGHVNWNVVDQSPSGHTTAIHLRGGAL